MHISPGQTHGAAFRNAAVGDKERPPTSLYRAKALARVEVNVAALAILGAGAGFNLAAASADAYCRLNREITFFKGYLSHFL
jgi:hypothetical protein